LIWHENATMISHPFARKKAKGWGAEFHHSVQEQTVRATAGESRTDVE
jgi:hypothetical protein